MIEYGLRKKVDLYNIGKVYLVCICLVSVICLRDGDHILTLLIIINVTYTPHKYNYRENTHVDNITIDCVQLYSKME